MRYILTTPKIKIFISHFSDKILFSVTPDGMIKMQKNRFTLDFSIPYIHVSSVENVQEMTSQDCFSFNIVKPPV